MEAIFVNILDTGGTMVTVECRPNSLPVACFPINVNVHSTRYYCTCKPNDHFRILENDLLGREMVCVCTRAQAQYTIVTLLGLLFKW